MQDIEIRTRDSKGRLNVFNNGLGRVEVVAYADTPRGLLQARLPVTQEMLDDVPVTHFDDMLRDAMNRMIATSDELLRYRVSKLRERAALREAGGI